MAVSVGTRHVRVYSRRRRPSGFGAFLWMLFFLALIIAAVVH